MSLAKPLEQITLTAFEQMEKEDALIYELIDGIVMMSPRPAIRHQIISGNLRDAFNRILKPLGCHTIPEIELALNDDIIIPDLSVICDELSNFVDSTRYDKPPRIVVEIVSPSSASRDYVVKRHKYEQLGIQEYWIVSPEEQCIWVFSFKDNEQFHYCDSQSAQSYIIPELTVDLNEIFV